MKPQIALPFLLWTVFRRRWTSAAIAILVIAGGTALFCLRASVNPLNVAIRYAQIPQLYFNGEIAMGDCAAASARRSLRTRSRNRAGYRGDPPAAPCGDLRGRIPEDEQSVSLDVLGPAWRGSGGC